MNWEGKRRTETKNKYREITKRGIKKDWFRNQEDQGVTMKLLVLLAAPLSFLILHIALAAAASSTALVQLERWVRSGLQSLQWDQLERCLRTSSRSEAECRRLAHLPPSAVAVYVSEPRSTAGREVKGHASVAGIWFFYPVVQILHWNHLM